MSKKLRGDIPIGTIIAALIGVVLIIAAGFIFYNQYIKPQQRPDLVLDPSSQLVCNTFNIRFTIAGVSQTVASVQIIDSITSSVITPASSTYAPSTATSALLSVGTLVTYSGTVTPPAGGGCAFVASRDYIIRVTTKDQFGNQYTKDFRVAAT